MKTRRMKGFHLTLRNVPQPKIAILQRSLILLALLLFASSFGFGQSHSSQEAKTNTPWVLVKSGDAQLLFPDRPQETTKELRAETGFHTVVFDLYQATKESIEIDGNTSFVFSYSDYPNAENFNAMEKEAFFDRRRDGAILNSNGQILLEERIFYHGHEGRRCRSLLENGALVSNFYCYLIGNRFYIMQVITIRKFDHNAMIDKFLNSFELDHVTDAPASPVVSVDDYISIAKKHMANQETKKAISAYNSALEIDPNNETALVAIAICYMGLGDWENALDPCTRAIRANSKQAVAYFIRGAAKMNLGLDGCSDFLVSKNLGFDKGIDAYDESCIKK